MIIRDDVPGGVPDDPRPGLHRALHRFELKDPAPGLGRENMHDRGRGRLEQLDRRFLVLGEAAARRDRARLGRRRPQRDGVGLEHPYGRQNERPEDRDAQQEVCSHAVPILAGLCGDEEPTASLTEQQTPADPGPRASAGLVAGACAAYLCTMGFYQGMLLPPLLDWAMRDRHLAPYRRRTLEAAEGFVLEIGAGSGLNFPRYAAGLDRVVALDPSPPLLLLAARRRGEARVPVSLLRGTAERLPFAAAYSIRS